MYKIMSKFQAYYDLTILVQQQDAGPSSDGTLRVHVIDVNEPHEITNLPMTVTLDSADNNENGNTDLVCRIDLVELVPDTLLMTIS